MRRGKPRPTGGRREERRPGPARQAGPTGAGSGGCRRRRWIGRWGRRTSGMGGYSLGGGGAGRCHRSPGLSWGRPVGACFCCCGANPNARLRRVKPGVWLANTQNCPCFEFFFSVFPSALPPTTETHQPQQAERGEEQGGRLGDRGGIGGKGRRDGRCTRGAECGRDGPRKRNKLIAGPEIATPQIDQRGLRRGIARVREVFTAGDHNRVVEERVQTC